MRGTVSEKGRGPLRADQARQTRARILDGLLMAMRDGLSELSVPAVARAAKVSVPTVYRYFPTKKALFEALMGHVGGRIGLDGVSAPAGPEGLSAWVERVFERLDALDPVTAAAMAGALGGEARRKTIMPERLQLLRRALGPTLDALSPEDREHLVHVAVVLTSSASLRAFKTYLGLDARGAAAAVNWALAALARPGRAHRRGSWKRPRPKR